MPDSKPSVLITGANGFVGARLCRLFLDEGCRVIAGVRKTANLSQLEKLDVEYRYGDITRPETLPEMVSGVDYIVHNAGVVKAKRERTFFEVNEKGTRSLMEAIAQHNPLVKRVVYISSLAAFGPSQIGHPLTEDAPPQPLTAYGRSKLKGEQVALSFADRFNVVAVRPPGVYGPGDREILAFFQTVNNRIKPYIGNTGRMLQLVHVDDLCRGIYLAAIGGAATGEAYFIAEKNGYTMKQLIAMLEAAGGKKAFPLIIPGPLFRAIALISETVFKAVGATPMLTREKANELLASWEVSTEKARRELGYESRITFEQGARETYAWYKQEGWL